MKKGSPYFAEIEEGQVDEDQLGLAAELIKRKTAPFDPRKFTDHYEAALRELIKAKVEDRKVRIEPEAEPAGVVIDLMQALKKSLRRREGRRTTAKKPAQGQDSRRSAASPKPARSRRRSPRRPVPRRKSAPAASPPEPEAEALARYKAKRDFTRTPEPAGMAEAAEAGRLYVIQKHAARRLHYDLRLQLGGTLKSWAVTRGPSLTPGERRLAVHVEDHPLDYAGFEGDIPAASMAAGR